MFCLPSILEHSFIFADVMLAALFVVELLTLLFEFIIIVVEQQSEFNIIDLSYTESDILPIRLEFSIKSCTTILSSFMYKSFTLFKRV